MSLAGDPASRIEHSQLYFIAAEIALTMSYSLRLSRDVLSASAFILVVLATANSGAAQTVVQVFGTVGDVSGSYVGSLVTGQAVQATFVYETDESLATGAQTTPGTDPGHEFTSFYDFASPPYGATITIPAIGGTFNSAVAGVVVNDDMPMTAADLNNYVPDGTYDWIELLGSTTSDGPTGRPANGEEWTFAFFADPTWITDGSLIPDDLPGTYTPVMVGIEYDANENEIGLVWIDVNNVTVTPEPSALVLGLSAGLLLIPRRRRAGIR